MPATTPPFLRRPRSSGAAPVAAGTREAAATVEGWLAQRRRRRREIFGGRTLPDSAPVLKRPARTPAHPRKATPEPMART